MIYIWQGKPCFFYLQILFVMPIFVLSLRCSDFVLLLRHLPHAGVFLFAHNFRFVSISLILKSFLFSDSFFGFVFQTRFLILKSFLDLGIVFQKRFYFSTSFFLRKFGNRFSKTFFSPKFQSRFSESFFFYQFWISHRNWIFNCKEILDSCLQIGLFRNKRHRANTNK